MGVASDKVQPSLQESFDANFSVYKGAGLAIYGTGVYAKRLLSSVHGYRWVAIVDGKRTGKNFEGHEIVPLDEAAELADLLIIAAARQNIHLIYNRIEKDLPEDLPVFSIQGDCLNGRNVQDNSYWTQTLENLKQIIAVHDVISFDIFDTLLMRRTLFPDDIFAMVERRLACCGRRIPFVQWRREAVDMAADYSSFDDIYLNLIDRHADHILDLRIARDLELEYEKKLLVARQDMSKAFAYAKNLGKKICLTSDMYLSSVFLKKILEGQAIAGWDEMFLSCEQKASKSDGSLFAVLKARYPTQNILHIGDNEIVDVIEAQAAGLDTYRVYSAYSLLTESSLSFLLDKAVNLDDHLLLGDIAADLLNSPFAMHEGQGKLHFASIRQMAVMLVAGLTMAYLQFMAAKTWADNKALILFVSRDGYFLQQIWSDLRSKWGDLPESVYLYCSRQAACGACVKDVDDIDVLLEDVAEYGSMCLAELLQQRFQINFSGLTKEMSCTEAWRYLGLPGIRELVLRKSEEIFDIEAQQRSAYLAYLQKLPLQGRNLYLMDIVTKGTAVYALSRILDKPVHLICFGLRNYPNACLQNPGMIDALYGDAWSFSPFGGFWTLLEAAFASDEGQLEGFNDEGEPKFLSGTEYATDLTGQMQEALTDFLAAYPDAKWLRRTVSPDLAAALLSVLDRQYSLIAPEIYDLFRFHSPTASGGWLNLLKNMRGENIE